VKLWVTSEVRAGGKLAFGTESVLTKGVTLQFIFRADTMPFGAGRKIHLRETARTMGPVRLAFILDL